MPGETGSSAPLNLGAKVLFLLLTRHSDLIRIEVRPLLTVKCSSDCIFPNPVPRE